VLIALVTHLDWDANRYTRARTPVNRHSFGYSFFRHMLWKCNSVRGSCGDRTRWGIGGEKALLSKFGFAREELGKKTIKLEVELDTQLDAARCAAADEWVADADVARRGDNSTTSSTGIAHFTPVHYLGAVN
jgi:hypothetical protein